MCTCAEFRNEDTYFGRNLDYEFSYGEEVCVMPRNYVINLRHEGSINNHYAMIGMAHMANDMPLYYDAINEYGLGMAGLNFVGNAYFKPFTEGEKNITTFEFITYVLAKCKNVEEAIALIKGINLCDTPLSSSMPIAQLHWMLSDTEGKCIVVEFRKEGLFIHDNKFGVMTNNPPFEYQAFNMNNYSKLSPKDPEFKLNDVDLYRYSRGMGSMGLPGDLSSMSRFVKVAFTKLFSKADKDEISSVSQFFHILASVEQQKGCCEVRENEYEYTIYYSCGNLNKGIYYYVTYDGHQINAVDMHKEDLDGAKTITYPMLLKPVINYQN